MKSNKMSNVLNVIWLFLKKGIWFLGSFGNDIFLEYLKEN